MDKMYKDGLRQSRIAVGMFSEGWYSVSSSLAGWRMRGAGVSLITLSLLLVVSCGGSGESIGDSSVGERTVLKLGTTSQGSDEIVGCEIDIDCDNDGILDTVDIDDDGDGLIEIRNASELDAVRYQLDGSGFRRAAGAILSQIGCGNRADISSCFGYELVRNISLAGYIDEKYPTEGWQPIAHDINTSNDICDGDTFTGVFDGNGFEVRDLFINRPQQDCIGLFGQANGVVIRDLGVLADGIIGGQRVGGVIGYSSNGAKIIRSYVISGSELRGTYSVGGLIGDGSEAKIVQSYVVSDELKRGPNMGGLIGYGRGSEIVQSYAVSSKLSGNNHLGGLVGSGQDAKLVHSYAVSGELSGSSNVGGLVGSNGIAQASYWDNRTSSRTNDGATGSLSKTSSALYSPISYTGIYATWDDGLMVDSIDNNATIWCDEDSSGSIEPDEMRDSNRVWDFGTSQDYPAIRCTDDSLARQRAWWYLNSTTGKPQLNQTYFDKWRDSDGDGISNIFDNCPLVANGDQLDTDNDGKGDVCDDDKDGDGVLDIDEVAVRCILDPDCDDDGLWDNHSREQLSYGGTPCAIKPDCDGDGVNDIDEGADRCVVDTDCDNDGLRDNHPTERLSYEGTSCAILADCDGDGLEDPHLKERLSYGGTSCAILADCDRDDVLDIDEVEFRCIVDPDCDADGLKDNHRIEKLRNRGGAYCAVLADCDNDGLRDNHRIEQLSYGGTSCAILADCDDDDVDDPDEALDRCVVDRDCDDDGLRDNHRIEQLSYGGTSCAIRPDCDNDGLRDNHRIEQLSYGGTSCAIRPDCDNDGLRDNHRIEQLSYGGTSCAIRPDCDNDGLRDNHRIEQLSYGGTSCAIRPDCDGDGLRDPHRIEQLNYGGRSCAIKPDCDNDGLRDNHRIEQLSYGGTSCAIRPDCDGDGLRDPHRIEQLSYGGRSCAIRPDCDGDGLRDDHRIEQLSYRGISCSRLADCDGDRVRDPDEIMDRCVVDTDCDNDNENDNVDVDADGDGLIEVGSPSQLNAVRYQLNGQGKRDRANGNLNSRGCGGVGSITSCNGYELVRDISLAGYRSGSGWLPIAHDTNTHNNDCDGIRFTGIFEGNDFVVRNLFINRPYQNCIGLFGQATGTIRNLRVIADTIKGYTAMGGLVGWGEGVTITGSSVVSNGVIGGGVYVGGLVGNGRNARITSSYAVHDEVRGGYYVGGLVGRAPSAHIVQSFAVSDTVKGTSNSIGEIGGLVGIGDSVQIVQSYAVTDEIRGDSRIGGLVGRGGSASIVQSYAISNVLHANDYDVGGLMGWEQRAYIYDSYAVTGSVRGRGSLGGLIGWDLHNNVYHSYWDRGTIGIGAATDWGASTTSAMRSPTGYSGIYREWENNPFSSGTIAGVSGSTSRFCHGHGGWVWDFGSSRQYPVLRCTPDTPADQRAWWSLTGSGASLRPQLNQDRLDDWLDGTLP